MPTPAQLLTQRLATLAAGEDAPQPFVGRFPTNLSAATFKYTLTAQPGQSPALEVVSGADLTVEVVADGAEYVTTITVYYRRAATLGLLQRDYNFDLWRTDAGFNNRLAAGVQPVVTPARKDA